jgi:flagellar basal-body rod modification protein FlgD
MPVDNAKFNALSGFTQMPDSQHARKPSSELKPDDFMTLFIAQLKHQNPMQPTDSSAILQQMSQLSALKSNNQMQDTLKGLEKNIDLSLDRTQLLQATQSVGRDVEVLSKSAPLTKSGLNGSVSIPQLQPGEIAKKVTLTITDAEGHEVKKIALDDAKDAGLIDFKWDGLKDDMTPYEQGDYKISATAEIGGKVKPLITLGTFKVNSVALGTDGVVLNLDRAGGVSIKNIIKYL